MNLTQSKLLSMANEAEKIVSATLNKEVPKIKYELSNTKNIGGTANKRKSLIQVSKYVASHRDENETMNTLIHEILHIIADHKDGHTGKWKLYANKFNRTEMAKKYGNITRCYTPTESQKQEYKFVLKCKGCRDEIGRHRNSDFVKNYHDYSCIKCGGKFERIK